jgi:hypothetical protein
MVAEGHSTPNARRSSPSPSVPVSKRILRGQGFRVGCDGYACRGPADSAQVIRQHIQQRSLLLLALGVRDPNEAWPPPCIVP